MTYKMLIPLLRSCRTTACHATVVVAVFVSVAAAATFQPGDGVKLSREAPLYFRDKLYRTGKANESFVVLAYRPETKKVFVNATDEEGRQIALSIAEEAVMLIPKDAEELKNRAVDAAQAGNFADAIRLADEAVRARPEDAGLQQTRAAIDQVQNAAARLGRATDEQKRISTRAAQMRKNASVTDRPNLLIPNDTSNSARAQQMRREADRTDQTAKEAVKTAADALTSAKASLTNLGIAQRSGDLPVENPSGAPTQIAQVGAQGSAKSDMIRESLKQWLEDRAVVPDIVASGSWSPTYEETLQFINDKISGKHMRIWFGEKTGKMILNHRDGVYVFDPSVLSADLKLRTTTYNDSGITFEKLIVSKRSGAPDFTYFPNWGDAKPQRASDFILESGDTIETEKLGKALQHLIYMFGGKGDLF